MQRGEGGRGERCANKYALPGFARAGKTSFLLLYVRKERLLASCGGGRVGCLREALIGECMGSGVEIVGHSIGRNVCAGVALSVKLALDRNGRWRGAVSGWRKAGEQLGRASEARKS
jgi:hypothetical protein